MNFNTLLLILFWVSFFVAHSLLAALPVKEWIMRWVGISAKNYRLQYVLLSFLHLVAIFIFTVAIRSPYLFQPGEISRFIGLALAASGIVICQRAFKSYDGKAFFGLTDLKGEEAFKTEGLLHYVRHPLYAGSIVLLIGFFLYIPNIANLVSVALMILYFIICIRFE